MSSLENSSQGWEWGRGAQPGAAGPYECLFRGMVLDGAPTPLPVISCLRAPRTCLQRPQSGAEAAVPPRVPSGFCIPGIPPAQQRISLLPVPGAAPGTHSSSLVRLLPAAAAVLTVCPLLGVHHAPSSALEPVTQPSTGWECGVSAVWGCSSAVTLHAPEVGVPVPGCSRPCHGKAAPQAQDRCSGPPNCSEEGKHAGLSNRVL